MADCQGNAEKLPQSAAIDVVQRARIQPDRVGRAQSKEEGAVAVPVDKRRQGLGIMISKTMNVQQKEQAAMIPFFKWIFCWLGA